VGSTERATALGDHAWRDLLDAHDDMTRRQLQRYRGREVKTTGDGFLATFDGPARAIRCAAAIREAAQRLGIQLRLGIHTGEVELRGDDVGASRSTSPPGWQRTPDLRRSWCHGRSPTWWRARRSCSRTAGSTR